MTVCDLHLSLYFLKASLKEPDIDNMTQDKV